MSFGIGMPSSSMFSRGVCRVRSVADWFSVRDPGWGRAQMGRRTLVGAGRVYGSRVLRGPGLRAVGLAQTALRDQRGLCPLCRELLLFADRAPESPSQWETWYAAIRKAMTRQAITDNSAGRTKHRLVHAYCARRHPDDGPSGTK
jgi:hypothetical protein